VSVKGRWNVGAATVVGEEIDVEERDRISAVCSVSLADCTLRGIAAGFDGIQASDLLAWYRAFHPDVAEGVTAEQYFTGGMIVRGWPLALGRWRFRAAEES